MVNLHFQFSTVINCLAGLGGARPSRREVRQGVRDQSDRDQPQSRSGSGGRGEAGRRRVLAQHQLRTDEGADLTRHLQAAAGTMDGIIDTVSAAHDLTPLIMLLRTHGKLVPVGSPGKPVQLPLYPLQSGGKSVAGSMIGGMTDTQEMVDFAADVEVIGMHDVNAAMERLQKGDVRYRFVIDVANTVARARELEFITQNMIALHMQ
ncbi:hypothetical protein GUJ93_ZPchr0006g42816 [Zizania palustris]|uniref:Alcohol dehydrogenase-like C-terminal domain-containing protein n=1 Tax=Zizania palustris TaxID=103762 RepID=A0A8J5VNT6_ZIZPA|nr:hypothetical protein GUJ93_ZPchr0006g42816 [Zizania palustris]